MDDRKQIEDYLSAQMVRKLQLGASTNLLEGWLNSDYQPAAPGVIYLDATRPFPFDDMTFDYVFTEHHIEHLTYEEGSFMLRECFRVLRPGGKVRVATNDLVSLLSLYAPEKTEIQQRYIKFITDSFLPHAPAYSECFVLNNAFHNWGHQFLYDRETLRRSIEHEGFVDVASFTPGHSDDPHLRGIERHGEEIGDEELNAFETMILEATRPKTT